MNLAFYTCFYGGDNNIAFTIPPIPSLKYNCYYFTNNKDILFKLKNTNWIGIYDVKPILDDLESARISKHVRVMPQNYDQIKNYDYLCYLDSKSGKINEAFIERQINNYFKQQNFALILRKHWIINGNVWYEYNGSINQTRYRLESEKYINYIISQIRSGLSEKTNDHCATGYLLRNMKHPKTIEINKTWFNHIQMCGIECQISFHFIKQMFSQHIRSFTENPFL